MTTFDISLKCTLFWGIWRQNWGSKGGKRTHLLIYRGINVIFGLNITWEVSKMRRMTTFDISPTFTLFWEHINLSFGKRQIHVFRSSISFGELNTVTLFLSTPIRWVVIVTTPNNGTFKRHNVWSKITTWDILH